MRIGAIVGACGVLVLVAGVLTGCASSGGAGGGGCVPRMTVSPRVAHPGATVTLAARDVCDVSVPEGGWQVDAFPTGEDTPHVSVRTTSRSTARGRCRSPSPRTSARGMPRSASRTGTTRRARTTPVARDRSGTSGSRRRRRHRRRRRRRRRRSLPSNRAAAYPALPSVAATSSAHTTPKRSRSCPARGAQADGASGCRISAPSDSADQYRSTSAASSPCTYT